MVTNDEIEDAFRKLQEHVYFENSDLHLRAKLVSFIDNDGINNLKKLCFFLNQKRYDNFQKYIDLIKLRYYPKKIDIGTSSKKDIPENFITNNVNKSECEIKRLSIFCDIPIELHVITILWIMKYGYRLDKALSRNTLGSRLLLFQGKLNIGRSLFKPYVKQYQKWWSTGIDAAKKLLDENEDVTIINFDLKDYFHSVEFNFAELELKFQKLGITKDPIHIVFELIHEKHLKNLREIRHPSIRHNVEKTYPLPIGILSSHILGNWHLRKLDSYIEQQIIPTNYGRYVDDIIIVLKGRIIKGLNEKNKTALSKYFERHKVENSDLKQLNFLNYFIFKYFSQLLTPYKDVINGKSANTNIYYKINLPKLSNLRLQDEKIFIYQFDSELSPGLITKFVEDQKERSSEFRFLSDQEDEGFDEFEENIFEQNFDTEDLNKARFKKIEENRYKLSVYLAKLIQRKIERGPIYKNDEVDKIEKYFKGVYALKYHIFWEKLFTLYLVSKDHRKFQNFYNQILRLIKLVKFEIGLSVDSSEVVDHLEDHLHYAVQMALGLDPNFIRNVASDSDINELDPYFFRKHGFIRKQFVVYPLLHLIKKVKHSPFPLIDINLFDNGVWKKGDFDFENLAFTPHRIKFFEAVLFTFRKTLHSDVGLVDLNLKRWKTDCFHTEKILEEAFNLFSNINLPLFDSAKRAEIKKEYFQHTKLPTIDTAPIGTQREKIELSECFMKNGGAAKDNYRVGLINKYIDLKDYEASLEGNPKITAERVETYYWILDQVNKIKDLDLFVLPELALPSQLLKKYVQFSAKNGQTFISGIEHIKIHNVGFNFVITNLPINIKGDRDAIPIIRLKNHYAPEEEEWIRGKKMVVPQAFPYRYDLFVWKGLYFSTYYCFELANIFHRSCFYSMLDLICAPVWNPDTHYYNNIFESASRDMHCYMVQVNTSQYGDTRVIRPTDQVRKDKAKIKGGTVADYPVTVLVSDIEVKNLRYFQSLDYSAQKILNKEKKSFKPTPPDFPTENVKIRISNKPF